METNQTAVPGIQREFYLSIAAGVLFIAVNFIGLSLVPVYVLDLGYSDFLAGLQNTVFSVFCVAFRFILGPMADHKGRRLMMHIGAGSFVAGPLMMLVAGSLYPVILVARVIMAVGMASFLSAANCYVAESVPDSFLGTAIGIQRGLYSLSLMVAPALGLMLARSDAGYTGLFLAAAGLGLVSFLLVSLMREHRPDCGDNQSIGRSLRESGGLLTRPDMGRAYLALFSISVSYGAILSYAAIYLERFGSIGNPGVYFTFFAGSGLVGSVVAGILSDRFGRRRVAAPLMLSMAVGVALLYLVPVQPVLFMILSGLLAGTSFTGAMAVLISWLLDMAPASLRGTAMGLQENSIDSGLAVGSLVFAVLTLGFTQQMVFPMLGILGILIPFRLKLKKVVSHPEQI